MTRSVRFTPLLRAGCFVTAAGLAASAAADQVGYGFPVTVASLPGATVGALAPADIDRDGDPDLYLTLPGENRVVALRNTSGSFTQLNVATGVTGASDLATARLDRDRHDDVVVAAPGAGAVLGFRSIAGDFWQPRTIAAALPGAASVAAGDLDRDGDADVVAGSTAGVLAWYSNDGGSGAVWSPHTIATGLGALTSVAVADLDGDGDRDVLTVSASGPVWYENAGNASAFTARTAGTASAPTHVAAADVDRDGDVDVVSWGAGSGIAWHESTGASWTTHPIAGGAPLGAATVADLDGDGDLDVWAARPSVTSGWYDNDGAGGFTLRNVFAEPSPTALATADLDRDGDTDVLSASQASGGAVRRLPNDTTHRNACFRPEATVFASADKPRSILPADVDGDGDLDLVTGHATADVTLWHENLGGAGSWATHTLSTVPLRNGQLGVGDVDGDGDLDVAADVGTGYGSGSLGIFWLENVTPGAPFVQRVISTMTASYSGRVDLADIDGDGDLDAFVAPGIGYGSASRWFRNPGGGASPWAPTPLAADQSRLADVDGDGDLDVFGWIQFYGTFFWRENVNGDGSVWQTHDIVTPPAFHSGAGLAGDVDRDGDPEVFALGGPLYRNGQFGQTWTPETPPANQAAHQLADLDVDGDQDLAGIAPFVLAWSRNIDGVGGAWQFNHVPVTHATTSQSSPLVTADLDADGDADLVTAPANALVWLRNAGGQATVAAENQAPGTSQQGTRVAMLRVVVTHLGLPTETVLEPTRFRIRLEEAPGDPLTTDEANALVNVLSVYRDVNGNGVFDPNDDQQAAQGLLALVDGVQELDFPTSTANEIAVGTPATFFVVALLTNDAATQNPSRFRATLLTEGPSASVFRHKMWSTPIRLACPVDVPSNVTVATVPVELMGFSVE